MDGTARDRRPLIAIGATIALVAVVAVVLAAGAGSSGETPAAPARCVEAWNADPDAVAYGIHNYGTHGYERVQVTMLTEKGEDPGDGEDSVCAVIFGALELDSEPVAAGQVLVEGIWQPLALQQGVDITRVAELQTIAYGDANSSLDGQGELVPN
jgi:hypothetical protein